VAMVLSTGSSCIQQATCVMAHNASKRVFMVDVESLPAAACA
jgi:hypothetical protein